MTPLAAFVIFGLLGLGIFGGALWARKVLGL